MEAKTQVPVSCIPSSIRPLANFPPSVWGDQFLHIPQSIVIRDGEDQMVQQLKEEVKGELKATSKDYVKQLEMVDAIQRLGVAYHFQEEIDEILLEVFEKFDDYCENNLDLHTVALSFRLLRQHGYNVSSEVFKKFKDAKGDWIVPEIDPVKGMLEFFEAIHLRVRGEDVLDDGLVFTKSYLESVLPSLNTPPYAEQVSYALKQNCHRRGIPRVEARQYISVYPTFASHSKTLLRMAKMDFNQLQCLHKKELNEMYRWWKDLDVVKNFPYARDRAVESYLWAYAVYFEPDYTFGRKLCAKVLALLTILDDTFDAYGIYEELKLFVEATEMWEDISCSDQLPDSMKFLYQVWLQFFKEIEEEMTKRGAVYRYTYFKEAVKFLVRCYFAEIEWREKKYTPTMEEYIRTATGSCGYRTCIVASFIDMGDMATKEAFEWVLSWPNIVRASTILCRLQDDISTDEFDREREHIPSAIECYMEQHKIRKQVAVEKLNEEIEAAWKDINQAFLRPTQVPVPLLDRILNFSRVIQVYYSKGDWFTNVGPEMQALVKQTLIDQIPE